MRPHPAYEKGFRAYAYYLQALALEVQDRYGRGSQDRLAGVHAGVLAHPPVHRVQRRPLGPRESAELVVALRKGWAFLRRVHHEVEHPDLFDEEANALLPYSAWYAVHHVARAFAIAARHTPANGHDGQLNDLQRTVVCRGLLPRPWHMWATGCPQTGTTVIQGTSQTVPGRVHVLERPALGSFEDRIALMLKTTRKKDLERIFGERRAQGVTAKRTRRNLSDDEKNRAAAKLPATTTFNFLYRLRTRASYGEADLFVLGAKDEHDARRLAVSLAVVCDATVAALEALAVAYAGPHVIAHAAEAYADRTDSPLIGARAEAWSRAHRQSADRRPRRGMESSAALVGLPGRPG